MTAALALLLALCVARVAVNEGALQNPMETALIWQVVEGSGRTAEKRLNFLARHSPRVMGIVPCGPGNCSWSRELDQAGMLPPSLSARGVDATWWQLCRRDRWLAILYAAQRLVAGAVHAQPCSTQPTTWGSITNKHDMAWSARHGLHRLYCRDALNDGWR